MFLVSRLKLEERDTLKLLSFCISLILSPVIMKRMKMLQQNYILLLKCEKKKEEPGSFLDNGLCDDDYHDGFEFLLSISPSTSLTL